MTEELKNLPPVPPQSEEEIDSNRLDAFYEKVKQKSKIYTDASEKDRAKRSNTAGKLISDFKRSQQDVEDMIKTEKEKVQAKGLNQTQ
jgi:hypothetical protein